MPSFFESLGRIIKGEPVFKPGDETVPPPSMTPPPQNLPGAPTPPPPRPGPKDMPAVYITNVQCREEDTGLSCELHIHNASTKQIQLRRIDLLGMTDELGSVLPPGAQREETVHIPRRPTNTMYHECKLYYDETGTTDRFMAVHLIQYSQLGDHTFTIRQLNYQPPIRDV